MPSACSAACPPGRSATTISSPRSRRCSGSAAPGWRPTGGPRSARTSTWMPSTASPGIEGAHEKGGVEGQIGWFRRNHLVPVPGVPSVEALNAMIDAWDADDEARRIGSRARTVGGVLRDRAAAAQAAARGAVRDRPVVHSAGGPLRPGHGAHQPVLGAGAADRPPGPGPAARLGPGHLRRARRGRPARAAARQVRCPPGPGPLPGGAGPQARRAARRDRAGAGPRRREVHPCPRRLVGRGPQGPRRRRRHPGADRGPAAAPSPGRTSTSSPGSPPRCGPGR